MKHSNKMTTWHSVFCTTAYRACEYVPRLAPSVPQIKALQDRVFYGFSAWQSTYDKWIEEGEKQIQWKAILFCIYVSGIPL